MNTNTVFFQPDGSVSQRRLSLIVTPGGALTGMRWTPAVSSGTSTSWAPIPGASPMTMSVAVTVPGQRLLLDAAITRIAHSVSGVNTQFRLLCDGVELALTNAGDGVGGFASSIAWHATTPVLSVGTHVIDVHYRTASGTVTFQSDGQVCVRACVVLYCASCVVFLMRACVRACACLLRVCTECARASIDGHADC